MTALAIDGVSSDSNNSIREIAVAGVIYGFGALVLLLNGVLRTRDAADAETTPPPPAQLEHIDHRCFYWGGTADSAIEHLHSHGLQVLGSPTLRHGTYGEGQSIFFHDQAGRLVELIAYG